MLCVNLASQAPQGYSDHQAGLMGATLLLCGIVAAVVTAPLFDRVFTLVDVFLCFSF
jgi:hypothetical protein